MKAGIPKQLEYYVKEDGSSPFLEWFNALVDKQAKAKIQTRLDRLSLGNPGDYKALVEDIFELKIDLSPGYRVYCGEVSNVLIILLCGGNKKSKKQQSQDIEDAKSFWADYKGRMEATEND